MGQVTMCPSGCRMQPAKAGDVGHKGVPIVSAATIIAPRMAVAMSILPLQRSAGRAAISRRGLLLQVICAR
jgi:hypothetical protein